MHMQMQAREALKALKGAKSTRGTFRMIERDVVVFWGLSRGWSDIKIADELGVSVSTILRQRNRIYAEPWRIFDAPVLNEGASLYRCEFCNKRYKLKQHRQAKEHVAEHVIPRDFIQMNGIEAPGVGV